MKIVLLFILIIKTILNSSVVSASDGPTNANASVQTSLLLDSEQVLNITDNDIPILRYGFQKTQDCQVFEKAFLCISKCLNKRYDIAHTDKNCVCTCKHNREIKKHKMSILKWPLTAPTTSLPSWEKKKLHNDHIRHKLYAKGKSPLKEFELYGDVPYPGDDKHAVDAHSLVQTDATSYSNQAPDAQKQESNKQKNPETPDPNESQHSDGAGSATSVADPNEAVHSTSVPDTNDAQNSTSLSDSNGTHDATTGSDPNEPQDSTTVPPITSG